VGATVAVGLGVAEATGVAAGPEGWDGLDTEPKVPVPEVVELPLEPGFVPWVEGEDAETENALELSPSWNVTDAAGETVVARVTVHCSVEDAPAAIVRVPLVASPVGVNLEES